jgi:ubiquinone/menaquinone biosynthesis C-methylase UbiE
MTLSHSARRLRNIRLQSRVHRPEAGIRRFPACVRRIELQLALKAGYDRFGKENLMPASVSAAKPYKGWGMEGAVARWYAALTRKSLEEFKALAARTAKQIPSHGSVLEVAPGPGYFAIELAKLGDYQITGLDISQTFVEIARANAAKAGVRVDFRQGNASGMPFSDETFDFLLCRAAFKNFSEPVRALEEMHRVLKPRGQALIIDLRRDTTVESISQTVDDMHVGAVNGIITKLTFRFMLLKCAYTKREFEELISNTKFDGVEIREDPIGLEILLSKDLAMPRSHSAIG